MVHPIKLKQDLRVFWKLVNLQDCVWESHYQIIMKTILQEKETIHYSITIWFTNLFLCLKDAPDDILEGLYKLRIRDSEKAQDRIGIV